VGAKTASIGAKMQPVADIRGRGIRRLEVALEIEFNLREE